MKIKFFAAAFIAILFAATVFPHRTHAQGAPQRIEITAQRFNYTPNEITLKKDVPVVFVVTGKDANHGLKFKDLNIDMKIKKDTTTEVPFTPTTVGTFTGQCSVFCGSGHGSMKMTLHVTE